MRKTSAPRVVGPVWKYPADDDDKIPHARQLEPGNSAVHADGVREPHLRADGARSTRLSCQAWEAEVGIELDRRARLEHAGEIACGNSGRRSLDSAEPAGRPEQQSDGQLRGNAGRRRAECLRRGDRSARADRRPTSPASTRIRAPRAGSDMWERPRPNGDDNNFGFMAGDAAQRRPRRATSTIGCSRSTAPLSTIRRIWAPWRRSMRRPGSTLWVASYPRQEAISSATAVERDLNPAVIHDGRVFIAPSDADAIFAFDAVERPPALEVRSDRRRHQALSPAGRRQGTPGRDRQPRGAVRRQDRQAAARLARLGKVAGRLRPRALGRRHDLLADPERDPGPRSAHRPACRAADQAARDLSRQGGKPGRRRRLPDRRSGRRAGGLLPEQPPDRALPATDRACA